MTAAELLDLAPVIAVVAIEDADDAVPLARALVAGGLRAVEVTLRTDAALEAVARIAAEVPEAVVGAGTVVSAAQAEQAHAAGAGFLVSPGASPALLDALQAGPLPFLAGVATPSEVVALLERGITTAKLFPAEALGGTRLLRALAGPFPQVRFCPTGGITPALAPDYLVQPNVACVGASWLAEPALQRAGDWAEVERRAREAAALGAPVA